MALANMKPPPDGACECSGSSHEVIFISKYEIAGSYERPGSGFKCGVLAAESEIGTTETRGRDDCKG